MNWLAPILMIMLVASFASRVQADIKLLSSQQLPDITVSSTSDAEIELTTDGQPLSIDGVQFSCSCIRLQSAPKYLHQGEPSRLHVAYDGRGAPGDFTNRMVISYSADGKNGVWEQPLIIHTVLSGLDLRHEAFDFGRTSAVLMKPVELTLNNSGTRKFHIKSIDLPAGFTIDPDAFPALRSVSPQSTTTIALLPALTLPAGHYDDSLTLCLVDDEHAGVMENLVCKISGEVLAPDAVWETSDGDRNLVTALPLNVDRVTPKLLLKWPADKIISVDASGPFTVAGFSRSTVDPSTSVVTLAFRDAVEVGERVAGRVRVLMKSETCPMAEYQFDFKIASKLKVSIVRSTDAIVLKLLGNPPPNRLESGSVNDCHGKLIATFDVSGTVIKLTGENAGADFVMVNLRTGAGVPLQYLVPVPAQQ